MSEVRVCYRKLRKYKYQTLEDYSGQLPISVEIPIDTAFIKLNMEGVIIIKKGYAWDGPSGPTIDTSNFMRGSLVHDALYQLMRGYYLDYKKYRDTADNILRKMCIEDGMSAFRAWYVYTALKYFGESNARPQENVEDEVCYAP